MRRNVLPGDVVDGDSEGHREKPAHGQGVGVALAGPEHCQLFASGEINKDMDQVVGH